MADFTITKDPGHVLVTIPPGVLDLGTITIVIEPNIVNPAKVQDFGQWIIDNKADINVAVS